MSKEEIDRELNALDAKVIEGRGEKKSEPYFNPEHMKKCGEKGHIINKKVERCPICLYPPKKVRHNE